MKAMRDVADKPSAPQTATQTATATATPVFRPGGMSAGQLAHGHRVPLNATERLKRDHDGLLVRDRIVRRHGNDGFASIDAEDLRGRFRWWGLCAQRRPGIDGGRTAVLQQGDLEDEYLILRVRTPGGQLTTQQLRKGDLARRCARDVADITNRQEIQLNRVRTEDVPAIWWGQEPHR